jgi:dUTPase
MSGSILRHAYLAICLFLLTNSTLFHADLCLAEAQQGAETKASEDSLRVAEIMRKAIGATGGAEKIQEIQNLRIRTQGVLYHPESNREIQLNVTETIAFPNRTKQVFDIPQGQRIQALNGAEGWMKIGDQAGDLTESQIREMKRGLFRDTIGLFKRWSNDELRLEYFGQESIGGKTSHVVQVKDRSGEFINLYIDVGSHLVVKKSYRGASEVGLAALEEIYSEFKVIDGVRIPHRTIVRAKGKKFIESEIVKAEFNLKLGRDFFFPN